MTDILPKKKTFKTTEDDLVSLLKGVQCASGSKQSLKDLKTSFINPRTKNTTYKLSNTNFANCLKSVKKHLKEKDSSLSDEAEESIVKMFRGYIDLVNAEKPTGTLNTYMLYRKDNVKKITKQLEKAAKGPVSVLEISSKISEGYGSLSDKEKDKYVSLYEKNKVKYEKSKEAYDQKLTKYFDSFIKKDE